jgi:hypothetical protein
MRVIRAMALGLCFGLPLTSLVGAAAADDLAVALGHREDVSIVPAVRECPGELYVNHDGTFENGYAWGYGGVCPPDWGSWAEGYDLGAGTVACGVYWVTQIGYYFGQGIDCYIWEGGVNGPPGTVLLMLTGIVLENVPFWPLVGENTVAMDIEVPGEFSVGYWPANYATTAPF